MLTADLAMSWVRGRRTGPRALDVGDPALVATADDLVTIVREHVGQPRAELDRALDDYIGAGTDYRTIRGLIKLLADRCEFETASGVDPVELRRAVFLRAREAHPVVTDLARERALTAAADALGLRRDDVERWLYADLTDNQRLVAFDAPEPAALLDGYNLAQAQALLYRCVRMTIRIEPQPAAGYRRFFEAVKAFRLIYDLRGSAETGYEVTLDGPVSIFHRSQKYGVQMAVFLPSLLGCEGWRMTAEIDARPRGTAVYELSSATAKIRAPEAYEPAPRHPAVEKILAGLLRADGAWRAEPSAEVIDAGETAFVPDVVARHEDGSVVYVEVVGFWTPKYLATRLAELDRAPGVAYLFVASEELLATRDAAPPSHPSVVLFKTAVDLKAVGSALERLRCREGRGMA